MSDHPSQLLQEQDLLSLQQEIERLKIKCEFLEKVVHQVPANIYISDLEEGVVWCNKTNEETLGYTMKEIEEMSLMEYMQKIVHPEDLNIPEDSLQHYKHFEGPEYGGVFRAKHKHEEHYKWFMGWAKAFKETEDGKIKQILCVDVDMSQQMSTDKQLTQALKESLTIKNKLLIESLRKREVEILNLICQGMRTKAIADKLFISTNTVSTHRKNIQKKLGTASLADLVSLAKEAGLG